MVVLLLLGFVATMTFNRDLAGIIAERAYLQIVSTFSIIFIIFCLFSIIDLKEKQNICLFILTIYVVLLINGIRLLIIVLALGIVFTLYSNTLKIYTKIKPN